MQHYCKVFLVIIFLSDLLMAGRGAQFGQGFHPCPFNSEKRSEFACKTTILKEQNTEESHAGHALLKETCHSAWSPGSVLIIAITLACVAALGAGGLAFAVVVLYDNRRQTDDRREHQDTVARDPVQCTEDP